MLSNHRTLLIVGTVYNIHSSKVSIIGYASCVRFDFLYIGAIFYDVNSLGGSLKYAEQNHCLPFPSRTENDPKCVELGWRNIHLAVESYGAWGPKALRAF